MVLLLMLTAALQVHEWGIITSNELFTASPLSTAGEQTEPVFEDKAPVLYFHGDPCTVNVRVSFPNMGWATAALPEPSQGGINSTSLAWENLKLGHINTISSWPECDDTQFPVQLWREVQALDIIMENESDRFLYYECAPGSPGDLPFICQSGNTAIRMPYGEIPVIVLKSTLQGPMYGVFTISEIVNDIPRELQFLEDPEHLRREVRRWADGILFEDEFDAFWKTWESSFLSDMGKQVMILYPVPEEIINSFAEIEVVPERETEVELNRFVVAALPYKTL
ncbi:hypothetical protein CSA37_00065 [Candidatus Fermentibacteria bacterium]|nr:MAG: hypothetical protein CSA37_00065 [Candidatus Fermentibacteria bacterium]